MSLQMKAAAAGRRPMAGRPVQYQGDPGLFGSILGGIGGFLTGGPVGAIKGAVSGWKGAPKPAPATGLMQPPQSMPGVPGAPVPGFKGAVQRALPGGQTGYYDGAGPKPGLSGWRLNKSGYFLKSGEYVAPGTRWVKSRRRNPLNPRAASRAIARLESAKKAVKGLSRVSIRAKSSCR